MNFVQRLQEGGTGAWAALGLGFIALIAALFALVAMLNKSRSAFTLGIVTTLLGLAGAVFGMLGTLYGRIQVQQVLGSVESSVTAERLTRVAWSESSNASLFGFFAALIPLVLGAVAAMSGAKGNSGRTTLTVIFTALTAVAASGAWAMWHQAPPPGRFEFAADDSDAWQFASALENTDGDQRAACFRLEESLLIYWKPSDRDEWPRVMRVPIPEKLAERWKPAAKNCMQLQLASIDQPDGQEPRIKALLQSPLLHDEEQHRQLINWSARFKEIIAEATPPDAAPLDDTKLASKSIEVVIRQHVAELRSCDERVPTPKAGKVEVAFTINPDGSVSNAKSARAGSCVVKVFSRMKFPRPLDGKPVDVVYPLTSDN